MDIETSQAVEDSLLLIESRFDDFESKLSKSKIEKFFDHASKICIPLILTVGSVVFSLHNRITHIEETSADRFQIQTELSKVSAELMKDDVSYKAISDMLNKVDIKLDALRAGVEAVRDRVIHLEATSKK